MMQGVWLAVGAAGLLFTLLTLAGGFTGRLPEEFGAVTSAIALAFWGVFVMSAFGVETAVGGGSTVTNSYPSVAFLGTLGGLISVFTLGKATIASLDMSQTAP